MRIWLVQVLLVAQAFRPAIGAAQTAPTQDSARSSFADWLAEVRTEALARGIRQDIVEAALSNIPEPVPTVIERDRTQAEAVLSIERYLSRLLTTRLVSGARDALAANGELLDAVGARYGVPPSIITAIWGIESNFGRFSGVRPTVAALATLAYDPRRSTYFRKELFAALDILNRGDIEFSRMRGSWAGAMGQVQFMPSSYLTFAEDFDEDGTRDIWSSAADVFASIANYLKGHGWIEGESWGREVSVSAETARTIAGTVARRDGTCQATRDMTIARPMSEWTELGVRLSDGKALPIGAPDAALVSGTTRYFLVHHNYDAIIGYNCSHSYAIAVGLLADRTGAAPAARAARARPRKRPARRRG